MPAATPVHYAPVSILFKLHLWLGAICLLIFVVAAFLHWQHTRHWCLLALAIGSFLLALGAIAPRIGMMVFPGGSVQTIHSLITIGSWAGLCGVAVWTVGGIGAIHWAIRLRRRRE
jgi:hypothetical protein